MRLKGLISRLRPNKVMVIGDLLLDAYTVGKIRRISPEAPVPVLQVEREFQRPGGAGNVALNLVSLGTQVVAIGRIGRDATGETLVHSLASEGIDTGGILFQEAFQTPLKNRFICENQQIIRVDFEKIAPIPEVLEEEVIEAISKRLEGVHVIAISDYGKGFLSRSLLAAIMDLAKAADIPVIADPKGSDFTKYSGATMIKPNLSEALAGAGLPLDAPLKDVAAKILESAQAEMCLITRSEAGMSLFTKAGECQDFPVKAREVKDVTGAGDTALAMLTCAFASGLMMEEAIHLANAASGIAIERFGCARISLSDLAENLLEQDSVNKIFDEEDLFVLQQALLNKEFAVLGLYASEGLSSQLFKNIQQLAQHPNRKLVVYLCDAEPDEEFVNVLASLSGINFIIVKNESLRHLCESIRPNEVYLFEKGQIVALEHPQALLRVER